MCQVFDFRVYFDAKKIQNKENKYNKKKDHVILIFHMIIFFSHLSTSHLPSMLEGEHCIIFLT